jgi:hypothetical protein
MNLILILLDDTYIERTIFVCYKFLNRSEGNTAGSQSIHWMVITGMTMPVNG